MPKCELCGEEVTLPFECNYCGKIFCTKHRLPESHKCINLPKEAPGQIEEKGVEQEPNKQPQSINRKKSLSDRAKFSSEGEFHFEKGKDWEEKQRQGVKKRKVILSVLALSTAAVILCFFCLNPISLPNITLPNLSPKTYSREELVNYALSVINSERQSNGLHNVTISNTHCAQQHADNMLKYHFMSHWDLQGYKPHMRYTEAGGLGSVSENVAWIYYSTVTDAKEALRDLERSLENSFWHWCNIVTPFHNKVDIGIAYDNHNFYLVQEFENDYVIWDTLAVSNNEVTMKGAIQKQGLSLEHVAIYYDKPTVLTVQQLEKSPYNGSYDMGTFVGMALPSGWESVGGITITAKVWIQTEQNFEIKIELSKALMSYGNGVYTLCLQSDLENTSTEDNSLTSYSFWYDG